MAHCLVNNLTIDEEIYCPSVHLDCEIVFGIDAIFVVRLLNGESTNFKENNE